MRNKSPIIFLTIILFFFSNSCKQSRNHSLDRSLMDDIHEMYDERIASYPKELTTHFPKKIKKPGFSFDSPMPAGYYALHYSGFELFINYTDDKEKDKYLKKIKDVFIDTTIILNANVLFLNTIGGFCDSLDQNHILYPYPDVRDYVKILNEEQNEKIQYSSDLKHYTYYTIEIKDSIIYEEQKSNYCPILEKEFGHGFSRGIAINEKDKVLFYWLYFW